MALDLTSLSSEFVPTRNALHQLAFYVIAPSRYRATGRMGLTAVGAGFGTPAIEANEQIIVEGDILTRRRGSRSESVSLTTLAAAGEFLETPYQVEWFAGFRDPLPPADPTALLAVDEESSLQIGSWFGFVTDVLGTTRQFEGATDVSEIQLWPEHFDAATEIGSAALGMRASYGGSPGDDDHAEPYLYVASWGDIDRSNPYWNDPHFNGSSLGYRELSESGDPRGKALEFFANGYRALGNAL